MNLRKFTGNKRGAILPLAAIFISFVAFGATALVVDAGMVYAEKKAMITAADAGALAGAQILESSRGSNTTQAISAAELFAEKNGAEDAVAKIETRNNRQVIVVTAKVIKDNYFAKLIGFETTTVGSDAVATWGYVKEYIAEDLIPIYSFTDEYDTLSGGAIQFGLHDEQIGSNPANLGYFNIDGHGANTLEGMILGEVEISSVPSVLQNETGVVNEKIRSAFETRLEQAEALYKDSPEDKKNYMTVTMPIIDSDEFKQLNGSKLYLPVAYFANFVIEDVIKKDALGCEDALYLENYEHPSGSQQLYDGRTVNTGKETFTLYNATGDKYTHFIIVGRFTDDPPFQLRINVTNGDQNFPGNIDAATYYKLIE